MVVAGGGAPVMGRRGRGPPGVVRCWSRGGERRPGDGACYLLDFGTRRGHKAAHGEVRRRRPDAPSLYLVFVLFLTWGSTLE